MSSINHLYKTNNKTNRLLKIGYEKKLRQKDNELQAKKGVETTETPFKMAKVIKQPNLEDEDTGTQWKNDPAEWASYCSDEMTLIVGEVFFGLFFAVPIWATTGAAHCHTVIVNSHRRHNFYSANISAGEVFSQDDGY